MTTTASIEYFVVSGTLAAMGAFNTAVNAQVALGFAPLAGSQTDGTGIWQTMIRGAAASFINTYAITAVVIGPPSTLAIAGNQTQNFHPGYKFTISGSTGNDGVYTVISSVFGASTVITLKETLPSAVVDGIIIGNAPSVGP